MTQLDRYTLGDYPEVAEVYGVYGEDEVAARRAELAGIAWERAQAAGSSDLARYQDDVVAEELQGVARSREMRAAFRARVDALPPLDPQDPASLDAHGLHYTARRLRADRARLDHAARRGRVEREVASRDRLYRSLSTEFGPVVAERMMRGDYAAGDVA